MLVFYILCMQYEIMLMYMYTGMYINKNCIIYKCIHASYVFMFKCTLKDSIMIQNGKYII